MKAHLLFKDHDFDPEQKLPWNDTELTKDLELNTLLEAMSSDNDFLFKTAKSVIMSGPGNDSGTILFRQDILRDCLNNPSTVRDIYSIAEESIVKEKKNYWSITSKYPTSILFRSVEVLKMFVDMLRKLVTVVDEHAEKFESQGFTSLFSMLRSELDDEYFVIIRKHLAKLKFQDGVLISAGLGKGNKGNNYILRKLPGKKLSWLERIIVHYIFPGMKDGDESRLGRVFEKNQPSYTFDISSRDDSGVRALNELHDKGINLVANALAQSNDHILGFFKGLQTELAFYIGCLNLHDELKQIGLPAAFPYPEEPGRRVHSFKGLYDVCLALTIKQKVVGNEAVADNKNLIIITGANRGGKSTFLRSIGLSQLMMQSGMFVPAESFRANLCDSLFTHFKKGEDFTMKSGKLDEELSRMNRMVENITPYSMLLFNESFAATNEREGSEIARHIVSALSEKHIKVFFVTHLFKFAFGFYERMNNDIFFLRAERKDDGTRTFKLTEGEPLETSYGVDLYDKIFGNA